MNGGEEDADDGDQQASPQLVEMLDERHRALGVDFLPPTARIKGYAHSVVLGSSREVWIGRDAARIRRYDVRCR